MVFVMFAIRKWNAIKSFLLVLCFSSLEYGSLVHSRTMKQIAVVMILLNISYGKYEAKAFPPLIDL